MSLTVTPVALIWFWKFVPSAVFVNIILIPLFTGIVLVFGGVALFIYSTLHLIFPLQVAVYLSEEILALLKESVSIASGTIFQAREVSFMGALSLAIGHLALLALTMKFARKVERKTTSNHRMEPGSLEFQRGL